MKYLNRLILFCMMMAVFGVKAQTVTIGAGALTGASSNVGPIYRSSAASAFDFSQQYYLYTAAELSAAGIPPGSVITSIAWFKDNAFGTTAGNTSDIWNIFMKNSATVAAAGWSNTNFATQSAGATLVYANASQIIPVTTGWVTLPLTTSFIYTGGSLEIGSSWNCSLFAGSPSTGAYSWKRDNIANVCFGTSGSTATLTMASQTARPQIQISYVPGTVCSGAPVAGTTVSSSASVCPSTPFSLSLSGNTLASGLTYQWQSSSNGTVYTNIAGATNSAYTATQTSNTYYQCIVTCTASASSSSSTPILVNTNSFLNCYCTSTATSTADEEIIGVSLGTLNNVTSCGTGGGPGSVPFMYSDFTNTTPPTTVPFLIQGLSYPMTINIGTCGTGSFNNMTKVYIDYNQNGLFTDLGEEVYVSPTFTSGAHPESFTLNIPITASSGLTRMRVVTVETTVAANINPCGTYTWGETEDYFVNIAAPLADDAGITAFFTPSLPTCNFSDSVRVILTNFGTNPLTSVNIQWNWNGVPQTAVGWMGNLAQFATDTVTLGLVALASGNSLSANTTMPNLVIESPSGSWNDTSVIANLLSGLSGVKTIGGASPDYATFSDAVSALATFGVCNSVIFDVRDGVYNEQITLPSNLGLSSSKTVTFRSENANASLVTLTTAGTSAANNFTVRMTGSSHYRFENLTLENTGASFGTVVLMTGSSWNTFIGCQLKAPLSTSTSTNVAIVFSSGGIDSNNVFMNNTFTGGSYGMYWYGPSTTVFEKGNIIEGNTFTSQYYRALQAYYNDGIQIKNNIFNGTSAYAFRSAMYFFWVVGAAEITGNHVNGIGTNGWQYGIYWSQGGGSNAQSARIENNMMRAGWTGSTGANSALFLTGVGNLNVYHNTLLVSGGSAAAEAFYATGGGNVKIVNNILANYSSGYAVYLNDAFTVSSSDYNVLYSPAGNVGFVLGNQLTLANWQNASGHDANSINYNPNFYSDQDLHVCSDSIGNQGTPIASIAFDIDGHSRSTSTPDMGADEFNGIVGSFLGNDVTLCAGDSIQLIAGSPTDTILWSTGATTSSIWVSSPGSYSVTVNSACGTGSDAMVVTASNLNYAGYMTASDLVFCSGDSVLLTSSQAADAYLWSNGSTDSSIWVTAGGTYTLSISDACGSGVEGLTVTMNTAPTALYTSNISYLTAAFTNTSTSGGSTTYLWNFGGGSTSTLMNPTFIFPTTGDHTVTLTVTNACGSNTFTSVVTTWVLGLDEMSGIGAINVFPNPSTDVFNVNFDLQKEMSLNVEVTNVLGQVISNLEYNVQNGAFNEKIDLSNEAAGFYYLNIVSEGKALISKMLIKK